MLVMSSCVHTGKTNPRTMNTSSTMLLRLMPQNPGRVEDDCHGKSACSIDPQFALERESCTWGVLFAARCGAPGFWT